MARDGGRNLPEKRLARERGEKGGDGIAGKRKKTGAMGGEKEPDGKAGGTGARRGRRAVNPEGLNGRKVEHNEKKMEYLTLEYIKQHSRIDWDIEDSLLELYGESAEETMAQLLNRGRSVQDMVASLTAEYGDVPKAVYHGTLLIVDAAYNHRSPTGVQTMSILPYGIDVLVKPYMKLT